MRVLSADQPHPQLVVTRQPCDCRLAEVGCHHSTCGQYRMVKRIHTSAYPFPYLDERVAIYATKRCEFFIRINGKPSHPLDPGPHMKLPLPLGAIVGSCRVTASLPIVERNDMRHNEPPFITINTPTEALSLWHDEDHPTPWERIDDQLPYGDFTPGMHTWILEDAAPTTDRCPWCWGTGKRVGSCGHCRDRRVIQVGPAPTVNYGHGYSYPCPECSTPEGKAKPCPVCDGVGRCDPIPWTHPGGRHPEWTAT